MPDDTIQKIFPFFLKTRLIQFGNYLIVKKTNLWLRIGDYSRKLRRQVGIFGISLCGTFAAGILVVIPQIRSAVDAQPIPRDILTQLGVIYGTILALVLTLSMIPVQRAGEVWSRSIVHLYRRDRVAQATFIVLGIFCVMSFLVAIPGVFEMPASFALAGFLLILGTSFDLLRYYHNHVCQLLDPNYATRLALKKGRQTIDMIASSVTNDARLRHRLLTPEQKKQTSVENIESVIYQAISDHQNTVAYWINDIAEIAEKAVNRGEKALARTAISSISELTNYYLSARKQNLIVYPSLETLFTMESDVKLVTGRTYEALKDISQNAVTQGDEATALRVSEAYRDIAIHTANLSARAFREHTAPLTNAPIYYALTCIEYAENKGLKEVPFQSAAVLTSISLAAPKDVDQTDVHLPIIDGLYKIAMKSYENREYVLAENVNGQHLRILAHLLQRQNYCFIDVLRHVLEKTEGLAIFAIINEKISGLFSCHPLEMVYGLTKENSLGYLFEKAATILVKVDKERKWISPYANLVEVLDAIYRNIRNIAEKNELGDSMLLYDIDNTIRHIALVIIRLLDNPLRSECDDEKELVDKFRWLLSFYWVAFQRKKTISKQRADDCTESLACIGLLFFSRGYTEVLQSCISNIRSVMESYCETAKHIDNYVIGDLLANLWAIRMFVSGRNNTEILQEIDKAINDKPREMTADQWEAAQEQIELRRGQFEERLMKRSWGGIQPDSVEAILQKLLQDTA